MEQLHTKHPQPRAAAAHITRRRSLMTLTRASVYLRNHALKRLHDFGAFSILIVGEDARDQDDGCEHDAQVQL